MSDAISDQLLRMVRSTLKEKNMNTAALAGLLGRTRKETKQILSGKAPLLVDDFAQMAQLLDLEKNLLSLQETQDSPPINDQEDDAPAKLRSAPTEALSPDHTPDPYGNHAQQMLRFAFQLGVDILLLLETSQLENSNIPEHVQKQFQTRLPVRLDAIYHDKMKLRNHDLCFEILLSFDGLYECIIPWSAVEQVVLFPITEEPDSSDDIDEPEPGPPKLRLV